MTHIKSPVVAGNDYYPFGLTFNSYTRENSVTQRFKFQGQEHIDDLNLGWDSFKWRNHQPEIGRFFNIDPISEKYYYNSPYAFSENKVTSHVEIEGLESESIHINQEIKKVESTLKSVWNNLKTSVSKVVDAITPNTQIGKTDIEQKNSTPIAVDEKNGANTATNSGNDMDGQTNPLYNPNEVGNGSDNSETVMTQKGGQKTAENGGDPDKLKIDSTWTGKGEHIINNKADTIKAEVIVNGETKMVTTKIIVHGQKEKKENK